MNRPGFKILLLVLTALSFLWVVTISPNKVKVSEAGILSGPAADSTAFEQIYAETEEIGSVRSLLIWKQGEGMSEKYFQGMTPGQPMNIKSASKSIISLLVGIAVDRGLIKSVNEPINNYFPDYFGENVDFLKKSITIKDLLTMRSGLETTSFHNYGRWVTSDDWVEFVLEQPMVEEPGTDMVYSTGTSHLLSVIVSKASHISTRAFAVKYLFGPLNITVGGWDRDPQGYYMGGNNMALKPADMMKIGQMVLNGGTWQGQRVISKQWLEDSFKTFTRSNYNPYDYGYMWWNREVAGYKTYFAWGYGGQYIFMIPELKAVVVITSSLANATQRRRYKEPVFRLLGEFIIPGVLEKKVGP